MSNLTTHAQHELQAAGLFNKDSDYDGMIGDAVLDLVKVFAAQGHSGFSAGLTLDIFNRVANFKVLTPITSNPKEWMEVGSNMWQSNREPTIFSIDAGNTWYDIDDKEKKNWPKRDADIIDQPTI